MRATGSEAEADRSLTSAEAYWVYVLLSADGKRTYVGLTTDPDRRLAQHNGERPGGARATRPGRPWTRGALYGPFEGRGEATRVERAVKRRRGRARLGFVPPVLRAERPDPSSAD